MDVDGEDIPPISYDNLKQCILAKTPNKNSYGMGCWEWEGTLKKGGRYGVIDLRIQGDRMRVHAHRGSYIAFNKKFLLPYDISHCCHHSRCVNPDHLSHEPHDINRDRERCREAGSCYGHQADGKELKACIFKQTPEEWGE